MMPLGLIVVDVPSFAGNVFSHIAAPFTISTIILFGILLNGNAFQTARVLSFTVQMC